jgi:hypothetical protein
MIDHIGDFLQHNLVVLLAVVLVPMKWVILRICGDSEAQSVALLSIPEDICYVSLGLILGDMANSGGSFRKYFQSSSHISIDIFVTATLNVFVAILVHFFAKKGNDHFKTWRAAGVARTRNPASPGPQQLELPITATDELIQRIQIQHMAVFSLLYATQLAMVIWWLSWIAKVVSS